MAFAYKVNRVTLFGSVYGGAEEWSTGFFVGEVGADAAAPTQAGVDSVRDEWLTFWNTANNNISEQYRFEGAKIATLNLNGSTDTASVVYSYLGTPDPGPKVGMGYPPQLSIVASLLAAPGTGVARKGRMFLPGVADTISTGGKLTSTCPTSLATTLATFFTNLNGDADLQGTVILASKGGTNPVSAGANRVLASVKVGDVYDTQRRRRNQLVEQYYSSNVTN